jgi:pyrimidine deaminase RibD-like protein
VLTTNDRAYAQKLFEHRLNEELRPARYEKLKELRIKHSNRNQFPPSGSFARQLMQIQTTFAKQSALAFADALLEAHRRAYLPFDKESFNSALDDVRALLSSHEKGIRDIAMQEFRRGGPELVKSVEAQVSVDAQSRIGHIHDSILRLLTLRHEEWRMEADAADGKAANQNRMSSDDLRFARLAVEQAKKSVAEDEQPRPLVGAVVVRDGQVLATAHRGEVAGRHAEYTALEQKLRNTSLVGATVYTTLEPCTKRNDPKVACAHRLVERKVKKVWIGMLDPNPVVHGKGLDILRAANIEIQLFPHELMAELEELNRDFVRQFRQRRKRAKPSKGKKVARKPHGKP